MHVSDNEYRILHLFWNEGRPLTRGDILKGTEGRNWNPASIHLILNSMISKGLLRITDEEVKYGRTYEACYSREDYIKDTLKEIFPDGEDKDVWSAVLDAFVLKDGRPRKRVLSEIQKYVNERSQK